MRPGSFSLNKKDKKKRPMVLKVQRIPVTPKFVFLISIYRLGSDRRRDMIKLLFRYF